MSNLDKYEKVKEENDLDVWVKPGGTEVNLNRSPATIEMAQSLDWIRKNELEEAKKAAEVEVKKAKGENDALEALRAEYQEVVGKKPHHMLGADKLNEAIAEAKKAAE